MNSNNNVNSNSMNGLNNSINQMKNFISSKANNGALNPNVNCASNSMTSLKNPKVSSLEENNKIEINNLVNSNSNNTNEITSDTSSKNCKSKQSTRNESLNNSKNTNNNINRNNGANYNNSSNNNNKSDQDNLSEEERERLLSKIENEWKLEYKYIINNGFNGYNIKKLKETKMQLCHAEIEREKQLNLFGNAIEVLGYKEFYNVVHIIKFEFINFDIISQRQNVENIKNFRNLKSLIFRSNNLHGFYQIIKIENIKNIEYITIRKNEICNSEILKYFLVYRLQNIKYFNDVEITNKDVLMSKKIFENFDQAISICENETQRIKNEKDREKNNKDKDKENGSSSTANKKSRDKNDVEENELKFHFFNFAKLNLAQTLDEILDL